jgi:RNA polymerase sigma-70 factor (ECF subfamily)
MICIILFYIKRNTSAYLFTNFTGANTLLNTDQHIKNELLLRVATGDEIAFRQVFDLCKKPFHAVAFKITRSADAAEDVVQNVFINLWNNRVQVGAAKNPSGYLLTILHNSIYSYFRQLALETRVRQQFHEAQDDEEQSPVEALLLAKENRHLLEALLNRLPPQQQLVYRLSKQEGLSREEIAAKLQISPNTVKNHLAAAINFIRENAKNGASAIIWALIWNNI